MIDCENEVYTRVAQVLRTAHSGINVAGDYVNAPSGFPHVSIIQSDSKTVKEFTDEDEKMCRIILESIVPGDSDFDIPHTAGWQNRPVM